MTHTPSTRTAWLRGDDTLPASGLSGIVAPAGDGAGAPRPLPAATTERRIGAYLIDLVVVALPAVVAWFVWRSVPLAVVLVLEVAAAGALVEARTGATAGKAILRLRAAQLDRPFAPGLRREAPRAGLLGAAHVVPFGPLVLLLVRDRSGRYWHDVVARTRVVAPTAGASVRAAGVGAAGVGGAVVPGGAGTGRVRGQVGAAPGVPGMPARPGVGAGAGAGASRGPGTLGADGVPAIPVAPGRLGPIGTVVPPRPGSATMVPGTAGAAVAGEESVSLAVFRQQRGVVPPRPTGDPAARLAPSSATVPPEHAQRAAPPAGQPPIAQPQPSSSTAPGSRTVVPPRPDAQRPSGPATTPATTPGTTSPTPTPALPQTGSRLSPTAAPPRSATLRVHGDGTFVVRTSAVLGRRPDPAGSDVVVVLPDDTRAISRTHARLRVTDAGLVLEDLGSTNGCVVRGPSGGAVRVPSGGSTPVLSGSVLEIGHARIDVEETA
ncbi:FHA domain-containing protein [Miniimonas sp. S16]|uniref:FHA domain-containing protein n=1 Tax=Miniimonas sp. S16 TaxID=2171623 RepID=UPI00131F0FF9|nr:FHA domain-containing protein [Miniimonas sp. S16]